MAALDGLQSIDDMFKKLIREASRLHHAKNLEDRIDGIFNLCVTSISLRDWVMVHLDLPPNHKSRECQIFFKEFNKYKTLKLTCEIANTVKHFVITKGKPSTIGSIQSETREYINLFSEEQSATTHMEEFFISFINDDAQLGTFELVYHTIEDWISFLKEKGIEDIQDLDITSPNVGGKIFMSY